MQFPPLGVTWMAQILPRDGGIVKGRLSGAAGPGDPPLPSGERAG